MIGNKGPYKIRVITTNGEQFSFLDVAFYTWEDDVFLVMDHKEKPKRTVFVLKNVNCFEITERREP